MTELPSTSQLVNSSHGSFELSTHTGEREKDLEFLTHTHFMHLLLAMQGEDTEMAPYDTDP